MAAKIKWEAAASDEDVDKWDDHLEQLIDLFKPFLLDTLRVSHLLCLIHIEEVKDIASSIHKKEDNGYYQEACNDLLEAIKKSGERGKWQMFMDALKEVDNTIILRTLLDEKSHDDPWLDDQANRKLIELFGRSIVEHLNLENLLFMMIDKGLILPQDKEQLGALIHAGKSRDANTVLLLLMHRHSSSWYRDFLTVLYEADDHHKELAKEIDPEFCMKEQEKKNHQKEQLSAGGPSEGDLATEQKSQDLATRQSPGDEASIIGVNLGSDSGAKEKNMGAKSLAQAQRPLRAGDGEQANPGGEPGEATCACRCCAKLLTEVSSLRAELSELKTLIRSFVASGKKQS